MRVSGTIVVVVYTACLTCSERVKVQVFSFDGQVQSSPTTTVYTNRPFHKKTIKATLIKLTADTTDFLFYSGTNEI